MYFEGWYFKLQSAQGTLALIPAWHADAAGKKTASLQIVMEDRAYCLDMPWESFRVDSRELRITAGDSLFCMDGIRLLIDSKEVEAQGSVSFGPLSPLRYDIMGPFQYLPFLECRHSVFSMAHTVSGRVTAGGREFVFENDLGYIEGDRGRSFPKRYMWTQCVWREDSLCSLMLSVADIPYLGMCFTGVICIVLFIGREYRLATYLGAKAHPAGDGAMEIRQGGYTLTARKLIGSDVPLRAPILGGMTRLIREAPSCRVQYCFVKDGEVLFDRIADNAGFEYEYE